MNRLPPIAALRALEASSRHLSFTRAAEELYITQSAVSHQIRHLENLWGFKLFSRQCRRLIVTKEAQMIIPVVRDFIENMNRVLNEVQNTDIRSSIRISLIRSLAVTWLIPRLGRFNEIYPDINVWISTSEDLVNFSTDEVDVAIRLGYGQWTELHLDLLLKEFVFPVCSPQLLERLSPPKSPDDLLHYPLLYRHAFDICPRWRDWFRAAGVSAKSLPRGSRFPDTGLAIRAAVDNQGVALARSAHVEADLAAGRLVKLFDVYCPSTVSHFLVCPHTTVDQPRIASFRNWLMAEAAVSQKAFDLVGGRRDQAAA